MKPIKLSKVKECESSLNIAEYLYDANDTRMVQQNYLAGGMHGNTVRSWSDSLEVKAL